MTTESKEAKQSIKFKLFMIDPVTGKKIFKGRAYKYPKGEGFSTYIDGNRYFTVLDNAKPEEATEEGGA